VTAYRTLTARLPPEQGPFRAMPVQSAVMSTDDRSARRAEARRRARLAARGELSDQEEPEASAEPPRERGSFLTRMFPPAPALPNRPDPLAGFIGSGPLRPITERIYLLRRNLLAWVLPGVGASIGYIASLSYGGENVLGLVGTFIMFGSLIGAGWFGTQRPTLYGTAAGFLGFVVASALVLFSFAQRGAGIDTFGVGAIGQLFVQGLYLSGLGFIGGWYGGYLRRRQTQLSADQRTRQRRR
jgi:hypothetical protein